MEQQLIIPDGYELKKIDDSHYSIVKKEEPVQYHDDFYEDRSDWQDDDNFYRDIDSLGSMGGIHERQMKEAVQRRLNHFFTRKETETRDDYDFDNPPQYTPWADKELMESHDRGALLDKRLGDMSYMHDLYASGKIKKLDKQEMGLLRFCNGVDVKSFLKEEFTKNPINIKKDDNGNIYAEAPNSRENLGKTDPTPFLRTPEPDPDDGSDLMRD